MARFFWQRRLKAALILVAAVSLIAPPASAEFPTPGGGEDPYAYENYMHTDQFPPGDLGGDAWKFSSKNSCELGGPGPLSLPPGGNINCDPINVNNNPQELFGVTGASIDKAWETTTGRPDVVIAVHDSGVKWNDLGVMNDLNNKTWLNKGELPEPNWGTRDASHPFDRNFDGVFNIKDYIGDSRVSDLNGNGIIDPEDLIFKFSDGVDDDDNGYKDDLVGWDTYEDDNDPYDEVQYGHGSGEARDSTAEINNGGDAGVCPNCMVMHMRVGDSFIADVNDFAEGVLYAADNGASVIQSALGTLNNSRFAQEAIDYAYRRGVVLIASAADESAGHHNQPSVLEHAVNMNSIGEPQLPTSQPRSYLDFRGCTNFGASIHAAVPSNSCSSEAVGRSAGMAGLIYAAARNGVATGAINDYGALDGAGGVIAGRGVSAEEIKQIIGTTADDLNFTNPPYDQRAGFGIPTERYPASPGWDPFFGYGRVNADRMVRAVAQNKIPPEADISSPVWFATVDPDGGPIEIRGTVASRRSAKYAYTVRWGLWSWRDTNSSPGYTLDGVTLAKSGDQSQPIAGLLATIDSADIEAAMAIKNGILGATDGPAVDPLTGRGDNENRHLPDKFSVIVQLEVTAKDASGTPLTNIDDDPLQGIATKNFNFHDDPALFSGFPIDLEGDGAASPRFADLDNDGADELIVGTSNGEIHAYKFGGGEVAGWPVRTSNMQLHYEARPYQSGEISTPVHSAMLRSPAVGDLNRDGDLEVVAGDFQGRLWAFDRFGDVLPGFPVRSNPIYSQPDRFDRESGYYSRHPELIPGHYPGPSPLPNDPDLVPDLVNRKDKLNRLNRWFLAAPTLSNIDDDDDLEILAGSYDRHLYAFNENGSAVPGWPVMLRDPAKLDSNDSIDPTTHWVTDNEADDRLNSEGIVVSPAVGDINGDGTVEIVAAVNEQYKEEPNTDDEAIPRILDAVAIAEDADLNARADQGNNRIYAIHRDGYLHEGAPAENHPHSNAYMVNWPAKVASLLLELLPVVGNGPDGAPVIGNVDGGNDLEIGIFGTAGPAYIFGPDGASIYGRNPSGRDRTLLMESAGANSNSTDVPLTVPAVGGAIFTRLPGTSRLALAAPAAGLGKLLDVLLPEDQLVSDNHLSLWELAGSRVQLPAWPREVNDLQFLSTPGSADIDGDGLEELLNGSAYSDLHAFNLAGFEPGLKTLAADGWPKFTGGWTVAPPAVGDFDGDGARDVAHAIREGRLFAWNGNGAGVCDPASWPEFGHDGWNTNNIETDATRPGVITDLEVTQDPEGNATLSWTAPGADGRCGTAFSYDIRTSNSPITADNFEQANQVVAPTPGGAGTQQTVEVEDPGCFFAIRSWDADPDSDTAAQPANPSAISVAVGEQCADLSVTKTDSPDPMKPGKKLTYTIRVTNAGPATATGVSLIDNWSSDLPGGLTVESISTTSGSCVQSTLDSLSCDLGDLAEGATAVITVVLKPKGTGTIINTATVSGDQLDPQSQNNIASTSTKVGPG